MAGAGRPGLAGVLKQKISGRQFHVASHYLDRGQICLHPHDMSHFADQKSAMWELCRAW